jgi:hypothetical protein
MLIGDTASEQRLILAAKLLDRCEGIVMLEGVVALRPTHDAIWCEVIDPMQDTHRCEEEFKVLVENAARALASSKLAHLLPCRPLQWRVVHDDGFKTVELWREPAQTRF